MIDFETRLHEELERLVPLPDARDASWTDALARADRRRRWRGTRELELAAAFVAAVAVTLVLTPLGGALGRGIGDFSAWLSGEPGTPASQTERADFEQATRQWRSFPQGTQLRRLISVQAGGGTFTLFGFRSGDSLCLHLAVSGVPITRAAGPLPTSCAPLEQLRAADAPVVVVGTDYGIGHQDVAPTGAGYVPPLASVTFGIVADGVERLALVTNHGRSDATVGDNAFLAVADHPPLGLRSSEAIATTRDGAERRTAIAEAPFGDYGWPAARPGVAPGPTTVERTPEGGSIGWLTRHEPRGRSLDQAGLNGRFGGARHTFGRVVKPDPSGYLREAVFLHRSGVICHYLVGINGAGGGCFAPHDVFAHTPFTVDISVENGGDQYALLDGLATDDVRRMELYLATGERWAVPLKDNVFAVAVPRTKYPARIVAYDEQGRVIGIQAMSHDPLATTGPRPAGPLRLVLTVDGEHGTRGELRLGPSSDGGRCWRVSFSGGGGGGGCPPKETKSPPLALGVQDAGRDSFVTGEVAPAVVRVKLIFVSGRAVTVDPVERFVLDALPADDHLAEAVGLARGGEVVGRWRVH